MQAVYRKPIQWNEDWYDHSQQGYGGYGYHSHNPYGYTALGGYMDKDEQPGAVAAGRAFLVEQSLTLHRREKAAQLIQVRVLPGIGGAWGCAGAASSPPGRAAGGLQTSGLQGPA